MGAQQNRIGSFPHLENAMRYIAYAVDLVGIARAVYEIDCQTDKDAEDRAERFLDAHPVVEVWDGPRRVVRLVRESSN